MRSSTTSRIVREEIEHVDITGPCDVQVTLRKDHKVIWICATDKISNKQINMRICQIKSFEFVDDGKETA